MLQLMKLALADVDSVMSRGGWRLHVAFAVVIELQLGAGGKGCFWGECLCWRVLIAFTA
jgi:hypothetical protein